MILFASLVYR